MRLKATELVSFKWKTRAYHFWVSTLASSRVQTVIVFRAIVAAIISVVVAAAAVVVAGVADLTIIVCALNVFQLILRQEENYF